MKRIKIINGTQIVEQTHNADGLRTLCSVRPGTTRAQVAAALKGVDIPSGTPGAREQRKQVVADALAKAGLR